MLYSRVRSSPINPWNFLYIRRRFALQAFCRRDIYNRSYKMCSDPLFFSPKTFVSHFHCAKRLSANDLEPSEKELAPREQFFRKVLKKDKETFLRIIEAFNETDKHIKRGHIEFIYAALKFMEDFGVEGNLEVYKKLVDVFPKGKMVPKNLIQAEFFHFGRHQSCALLTLDTMERNGVCPDKEMGDIIQTAFGKSSHVYKKYARMKYWMPKLKNINPYQLPEPMPDDVRLLARLALKKMSVDKRTKIEEYETAELDDSVDKTWIMTAQSPDQQKLIAKHPVEQSLFVEGPILVWLRKLSMSYFVLRAEPKTFPPIDEADNDDVSDISLHMFGEKKPKAVVESPSTVHEQEDGTILGMCCTGTSSKDSVLSWIRFLRRQNPRLDEIPVLFKIKTSPSSLVAVNIDVKEKSSDGDGQDGPSQ